MSDRPNIILMVNDHQAYYRHGWDGGVRPQTPNFDRLAADGVRFTRSYAAVPLCGPSRRTLSTGLYPHNHGNFYNYTHPPYDREIYLNNLAQSGYRNFYFGKWHAGEGSALDFDCEGYSLPDYGNPYVTPEYHAYLKEKGLPPAEHYVERVFDSFVMNREFPDLKEGAAYRCNRYWCGEHAIGITTTPKETHEAYFLADMACKQLEALAQSEDDQPFHLRVDFWGPHQPYFPTQEFADLYDPEDIAEYGSYRDKLAGKPEFYWHDPHPLLTDDEGRFVVPSKLSWADWQHIIARAFAHITMIDAAGGLILDKLEELGLAENTLVIWTADHGDAVGSHGGRFDKGSYLTEEVLRVPLAMRYPEHIPPAQVTDAYACGTDIAPTILDAAGTQFAQRVDGESLLPIATGAQTEDRPSLLVETYGHGFGQIELSRGILKGRYKLIVYQDHDSELYDLEDDPFELNNLCGRDEYEAVVAELQAELRQWRKRTEDGDFDAAITDEFRQHDHLKYQELLDRRAVGNQAIRESEF